MNAYEHYQRIAAEHPRLPLPVELALMRQIQSSKSAEARRPLVERLVKHNIWCALAEATRIFKENSTLLEEAASIAVGVLFRLAPRVKDTGALFSCWARKRIRGELFEMSRRAPTVVISRYGIRKKTGESASTHAEEGARAPRCAIVPLDAPICSDPDDPFSTIGDTFASVEESPDAVVERKHDMHVALASLPERTRKIIEARFGLGGEAPVTLQVAARRFKISDERVRQIEHEALANMRDVLTYA